MPENAPPPRTQEGILTGPALLVQLAAGILSGVQGVVGEGASQALLRYGAFEQGRRIALDTGGSGLEQALARIDRTLGQSTHGVRQPGGPVRIECEASPVLAARHPLLDTVLVGLYEGILNGVLQTRFKGTIVERGQAGRAVLEFVPERA